MGDTTSMVLEVVTLEVRPGREAEFIAAYRPIAELVRRTPECAWNTFGQSTGSPTTFHSVSQWDSREAIDEFIRSEQFTAFASTLPSLFAATPRVEHSTVIV